MVTVYIGLGSNLGNRERNILAAVEHINETKGLKVLKQSSLYETEPVGGPPQEKYLNAAIEIECVFQPRELLDMLQQIENLLGRQRQGKNHPRTIDLDILLYNQLVLNEPGLIIPHPRMLERRFVLKPLTEIAPRLKHPVSHWTISVHLREICKGGVGVKS